MSIHTEAIVLKRKRLPSKDILVTLFTVEEGKVLAMAKGAKKITSTRSPRVQTGNLIKVILGTHSDRRYIQGAELISGFSRIKESTSRITYLYTVFYILDKLLPEMQKEIDIYRATRVFLIRLAREEAIGETYVAEYIGNLMSHLGFSKPEGSYKEVIALVETTIGEKIPVDIL